MGKITGISWTDHTFNPWWGCKKVSAGCDNCYAETLATKRMGLPIWGPVRTTTRKLWPFDSNHWQEPLKWNRRAEKEGRPHRVFCASMADVFEKHPMVEMSRFNLFSLIEHTPALEWQLLTKRPENIMRMIPAHWRNGLPSNVWVGTSAEDQHSYEQRISHLLEVPARVRWISAEPLLGPINFGLLGTLPASIRARYTLLAEELHWIVAGGESGPGFRALDLDWARGIRDECAQAGVPYFFKQVGGLRPKSNGDLLDGIEWKEFPEYA